MYNCGTEEIYIYKTIFLVKNYKESNASIIFIEASPLICRVGDSIA
jgi:hypothetical protein